MISPGQMFSSKYGSARGGKKMKGGRKVYGATQILMDDLANKGMGRGYVGISNARDACQSGGGLDSSAFKGQGHRPIHVNPGYGYVNPNDNNVLKGNLPQVNSYDQNACVGGGKKNKKRGKTMKKRSKKNIKKRNKRRRTKRNKKVKRKNMHGCGHCHCTHAKKNTKKHLKRKNTKKHLKNTKKHIKRKTYKRKQKGGSKQTTYAYTGKNVNSQLATPLSVPNIDSKAYNHCFSAYKH